MSFETLIIEDTLWSILIRFAINLFVLFILIRLIYYRFTRKVEIFYKNGNSA